MPSRVSCAVPTTRGGRGDEFSQMNATARTTTINDTIAVDGPEPTGLGFACPVGGIDLRPEVVSRLKALQIGPQLSRALEPDCPILFERLVNDALQFGGNLRVEAQGWLGGLVQDGVENSRRWYRREREASA